MSLKKVLAVIFLAALLVWGIYDVIQKDNKNNTAFENSKAKGELKSDTNTEVTTGIKEGNLAPDFQLVTLDGTKVKLSDYRGKKVILNFWATWCPPCKAEIPDIEKFYSSYKDKDVVVLGVDLTQSEKSKLAVSTFVKSSGITYPVLLDTEGTVAETYNVSAIPTTYILDAKGIIRKKIVRIMDYDTMKSLINDAGNTK